MDGAVAVKCMAVAEAAHVAAAPAAATRPVL
eukprot:CAMPEP_0115832626 /NCGR_PEP_ID=MMETSP0287-20121206/2756_1 /TAXON_ID=412157 /ORGANISM="Chrysochromulina rotalis, Strain UIO044" /LENGTH=30 /DNA_ID= /DNA_START= /DNA_END= /DNA_ORIENTATION=